MLAEVFEYFQRFPALGPARLRAQDNCAGKAILGGLASGG